MYAIVETGGKQYKVNKGMEFVVESLGKKEGSTVNLSHVMLASKGKKIYIGTPYIKKAKVVCDVLNKEKSDKIVTNLTKINLKNYSWENFGKQFIDFASKNCK
mgnify:CR=1 FL=1